MNKKSWKKKFIPELIVFLVVIVILALSFLTTDNQRKPINTPVSTSAVTQNKTPAEATEDIPAQTVEDSTKDKPVINSESTLEEPQVVHSSAVSPNSKYIAETYGVNKNITAGGLYPSDEIRIRELATDKIVWSMMGSYSCDFLWTSDSRYLAVSYTARIYSETVIVDTKDFTTDLIPVPEQIEENMQEFRPDVYLNAKEWMEDRKLLIDFTYTGKDSAEYSGNFIYDLTAGKVTAFLAENQIKEADSKTNQSPIDLSQIKERGNVSVTYVGGCDTLDELAQNAEVIVKGTAGKIISDKLMGVFISFNIENTIKGDIDKDNKLTVIQLKDGNELVEGETYVLALGKDYEEDTYHVIGGYQGIFSIENNEIYCKEPKYQDELKKISKDENTTSKPKLDILGESFSNRIKDSKLTE